MGVKMWCVGVPACAWVCEWFFLCFLNATILNLNSKESYVPAGRRTAHSDNISSSVIFMSVLNMEVRGQWQPVDTEQIYAPWAHTHTLMPGRGQPQPSSWRGTLWQWLLVAADLHVLPAPDTRSRVILRSTPWTVLIENGCGWEKERRTDGEKMEKRFSGERKVRTKANEREQRARRVRANADQAVCDCVLNSWPHESRTSFLPSALYLLLLLLLSDQEPNRLKHNVAFQYNIW